MEGFETTLGRYEVVKSLEAAELLSLAWTIERNQRFLDGKDKIRFKTKIGWKQGTEGSYYVSELPVGLGVV